MFFYYGTEITFGGWISSFATLTGTTDNQGATIFPTIYWGFMTLFRFLLLCIPGKGSYKAKVMIIGSILSGVISILIIYAG